MQIKSNRAKSFLGKTSLYSLFGLIMILGLGIFMLWGALNSPKMVLADHNVAVSLDRVSALSGSNENYVFQISNDGADAIYKLTIKAQDGFIVDVESIQCPEGWTVNFKSNSEQAICITDPDPEKETILLNGDSKEMSFTASAPELRNDAEYVWELNTKDNNWGVSVNKTAVTLVYSNSTKNSSPSVLSTENNIPTDKEDGVQDDGNATENDNEKENSEEQNNNEGQISESDGDGDGEVVDENAEEENNNSSSDEAAEDEQNNDDENNESDVDNSPDTTETNESEQL